MSSVSSSTTPILPENYPTIYIHGPTPKPAEAHFVFHKDAYHFTNAIGSVRSAAEFQALYEQYVNYDLNAGGRCNVTVLGEALKDCPLEVVQAILDQDPSLINKLHSDNYTPYIFLATSRDRKQPEFLKLLIDRGADINAISRETVTDIGAKTALSATVTGRATNLFATKYLLLQGAILYQNERARILAWKHATTEEKDDYKRAPENIHQAVQEIKKEYSQRHTYLTTLTKRKPTPFTHKIGPGPCALIMEFLIPHTNFMYRLNNGLPNNWTKPEIIDPLATISGLLKNEEFLRAEINRAVELGEDPERLLEDQAKLEQILQSLNEVPLETILTHYTLLHNGIVPAKQLESAEILSHFEIEEGLAPLPLIRRLEDAIEQEDQITRAAEAHQVLFEQTLEASLEQASLQSAEAALPVPAADLTAAQRREARYQAARSRLAAVKPQFEGPVKN